MVQRRAIPESQVLQTGIYTLAQARQNLSGPAFHCMSYARLGEKTDNLCPADRPEQLLHQNFPYRSGIFMLLYVRIVQERDCR